MRISFTSIIAVVFFAACGTTKVKPLTEVTVEQRQLDTLYVTAPAGPLEKAELPNTLPVYNASATQLTDLIHTKLDLRFDWEKEQVIGSAQLDCKPYFYPTNQLVLDAKYFDVQSVTLGSQKLGFENTGQQLVIQLDKTYTRNERYTVKIDYTVVPKAEGGSAAITSDKGLFFINPRGEEGDKPRQIWTQGETENSSRWFPTIDKPNQRTTQELTVTVPAAYKSLSNGILVSSKNNNDGTRTDYWKMDDPHAPYLFMLAVGDFAVVEDQPWNNIPVTYYVEPAYADHAKAIFPHTREMLGFFSEKTGVNYPWSKYAQIVVRDYVSGAMENTTAVIFGEFMQHTERELIDELMNDKIVAHEMFHHWFGDLVTCESWANLTLNEGFANYSEYLWLEHKYGKDEADMHLASEWEGYYGQAEEDMHPLIHYGYDDKEHMFDAHSYNKGGSVLHMLRGIVGDEAFFMALQKYLTDNAYTAVEVDELRMAFEDVTGQDLKWFFNQWYLSSGHPVLDVAYGYDTAKKEVIVNVQQIQEGEQVPHIYQLPVYVDVYLDGMPAKRHAITIDQRTQSFRLPAATQPKLVVFDAEHRLLARIAEEKSELEYGYQLANASTYFDAREAIEALSAMGASNLETAVQRGLQDEFYGIRLLALENIPEDMNGSLTRDLVYQLATSDPHSDVRATAIQMLTALSDARMVEAAQKALQARPYPVIAAGLEALGEADPANARNLVASFRNEKQEDIIAALGQIYSQANNAEDLGYFAEHLEDLDGFGAINFYESYAILAAGTGYTSADKVVKNLETVGVDQGQSPWRRFAAINALAELRNTLEENTPANKTAILGWTNAAIEAIKSKETNPQLKQIFQQY